MRTRAEWKEQCRIARRLAATETRRARATSGARKATPHDAVPGHLLDGWLLRRSPLYRRSRELFSAIGGEFRAELLSGPRSLGSAELTSPVIPYTPAGAELLWAMTDPIESRRPDHFARVRDYSTSLFHEQNHRVLWARLLPLPPPARDGSLMLYFNLAESLVVMLDQALGDELGPELAGFFYRAGTLYDPGTALRRESGSRRAWRNALHAGMYATYLALGGMPPRETRRLIRALYPEAGPLLDRAVVRSLRLDRKFIERTNPIWQGRHGEAARRAIAAIRGGALARDPGDRLPRDPRDHRLAWLTSERVLREYGI